MPYDPGNIVCETCWHIERDRRATEEPEDYFRNFRLEPRRFAPQETVWIDRQGYLHCRDHIPKDFYAGLTTDYNDDNACATCGSPPDYLDGLIRTPSGRLFCSVPHIPPDELNEKSQVRVGPCEGCGREIHTLSGQPKEGKLPRLFCSSRCRIRFYDLRKQAKRAEARKLRCEVCGEPFEPLRSNARTCSSACRQRAYRRRLEPA